MAEPLVTFKIEGLRELIAATDPVILRRPLRDFFRRVTLLVQNEARAYAPVDMGQLRNSIVSEVDKAEMPRWGNVGVLNAAAGSPLWFKARAMEFGTGRVGDPDVSHKPGHWPPAAALDTWGKRHGFGQGAGARIAQAIGRRGGLIGRRYLRIGFYLMRPRIPAQVRTLGADIARTWAARAARKASGGTLTAR